MYFSDIIGQEKAKERVRQMVQTDRLAHALLISGKEGVGKLGLALALAQYLHCTHRGEKEPCGVCPSCRKYKTLEHPDLHFAFPLEKSGAICDDFAKLFREQIVQNPYITRAEWMGILKNPNASGVIYTKESDEIFKKLTRKTFEAEYKIMIIWLPEKMHERGANKLLKLIEEPFPKTLLILVSDAEEEILQTIRSRVQPVLMPPLHLEDITHKLVENYGLNEDDAKEVASISEGSFSKAKELISRNGSTAEYFDFFTGLMRKAYMRDIKGLKEWSEKVVAIGREKQVVLLEYMLHLIRENFMNNLKSPSLLYMNKEEKNFAVKFSSFISERNVVELMQVFNLAEQQIAQNVNAKILFFDVALKVAILIKK